MILILRGLGSFLRIIVKTNEVPGLPLMSFTESSIFIPMVATSLIFKMISPDLTPALNAGVPSIGAMTVSAPSFIPIEMPSPPNSPLVCTERSLYALVSIKVECASRLVKSPLSALSTRSVVLTSSTYWLSMTLRICVNLM